MLVEYARLAVRSLSAYRLRSTLTVLAIAIGVTAVIVLVSVAQSGMATLARGIEEIGGSRYIMLWQDSPKKAALKQADYLDGLTLADDRALVSEIPLIASASPLIQSDGNYYVHRVGGTDTDCDRIGVDPNFVPAYAMHLVAGRNLDPSDLTDQRRVCLLGADLAKTLFGARSAVGHHVVLSGERFDVVGQLAYAAKGSFNFGFDWNNVAIVPITVLSPVGKISMIGLTSRNLSENTALINWANAILLARHNGVDDFQFFDFGGMLKGYKMVFLAMLVVVGLVAGVSLLIGGVGIMNIMLVAVHERRREIGVRKAIGATRSEILAQFLVESTVLGLLGAAIGTAAGLAITGLANVIGAHVQKGWVGEISEPAIVLAVLAAAGTGLFFGWYPARRAALLDPIACLRAD